MSVPLLSEIVTYTQSIGDTQSQLNLTVFQCRCHKIVCSGMPEQTRHMLKYVCFSTVHLNEMEFMY